HRGDPVVEGRAEVRVAGDVPHREVEGEEGVGQERQRAAEQREHADGRMLGRLQEHRPPARAGDTGRGAAVEREPEGDDERGLSQLRDHEPVFWSDLIRSRYPAPLPSWGALYSSECLARISVALKCPSGVQVPSTTAP